MHSSHRRDETARAGLVHKVRINNNVERDRSTQGYRCGYVSFSILDRGRLGPAATLQT